MRESVTIDEAIALLNELIALDRPAIAALLANRVPCNSAFACHPTVQVSTQNGGYHVGLMGIINGLFGIDEDQWGPIMYRFDENSNLIDFSRVEKENKHE